MYLQYALMYLQYAFAHCPPMRFLPLLLNPLGCHWIHCVLRPFRPCPATSATNLLLDAIDDGLENNDSTLVIDQHPTSITKPRMLILLVTSPPQSQPLSMNLPIYRILWINANIFYCNSDNNYMACWRSFINSSMANLRPPKAPLSI